MFGSLEKKHILFTLLQVAYTGGEKELVARANHRHDTIHIVSLAPLL